MITIVSGKLGAGKTLYCVSVMIEHLSKGGIVATNVDLDIPRVCTYALGKYGVRLQPDKQIITFDLNKNPNWQDVVPWGVLGSPVLCVLDEYHLFFGARNWAKNQSEFADLGSYFTQSRKVCVDIYVIAQESGTVDKSQRVQAEFELRIIPLSHIQFPILGGLPFRGFIAKKLSVKSGLLISTNWRLYRRDLFGCYKTLALLDDYMQKLEQKMPRRSRLKLERVSYFERLKASWQASVSRVKDAVKAEQAKRAQ